MLRALGIVGIVAIACNHGNGGGIAPADYATEAANAVCDYDVRCGLFADQASCLAYGLVSVDAGFLMLLDSGKATFDGNAAQACLDWISNRSCDQTQMDARVEIAACSQFVVGTVAMNGACEQNAECVSGACATADCQQACCTGTCVAAEGPAGSGDPCVTRSCDSSLACSMAGVCVPLGGSGAGCMLSSDCDFGLGCPAGECAPLPAIGDPCPTGECADIGAVCDDASMCVMVGLPGAPCTTNDDCSKYAECNGTTCVAQPTLGQPCDVGCSDGSYCNIPDGGSGVGTCDALGSDGDPCTRDAQCTSFNCGDTGCLPAAVCI
jgi:hypothetical protein